MNTHEKHLSPKRRVFILESTSSGKESGSPSDSEDDSKDQNDSIIAESVVQVDDGGSDLTDRFKYKVSVK